MQMCKYVGKLLYVQRSMSQQQQLRPPVMSAALISEAGLVGEVTKHTSVNVSPASVHLEDLMLVKLCSRFFSKHSTSPFTELHDKEVERKHI